MTIKKILLYIKLTKKIYVFIYFMKLLKDRMYEFYDSRMYRKTNKNKYE